MQQATGASMSSLTEQLAQFPTRSSAATATAGRVQFRRACSPGNAGGITHVLLHGIGSASASWLAQLLQVSNTAKPASHVLAWDAPGYGDSDALPMEAPRAADYAARLWAWLDALDADTQAPLTLVGHSLGALVAASAAVQRPGRVRRLVLLAPAQGYASADPQVREKKLSDRLANLAHWGPAGMAKKRAGLMLSPEAGAEQIAFVEHVMAGIRPHGYTQAARMLAGGRLAADLARVASPVIIASGSADTVTPSDGCEALARSIHAPYVSLGVVGHSCALEAAPGVNTLIGIAGEVR